MVSISKVAAEDILVERGARVRVRGGATLIYK
jgi:hypothetical protein